MSRENCFRFVNQNANCISAVILIKSCQGNSKKGSIHFQGLFLLKTFLSIWGIDASGKCGYNMRWNHHGIFGAETLSLFPVFSRSGITATKIPLKKAIFLPPFMEKVGRKTLTAGQSVLRLSCCFSLKKHQLLIILRGIAGIWFSDQQFNGSERVAW